MVYAHDRERQLQSVSVASNGKKCTNGPIFEGHDREGRVTLVKVGLSVQKVIFLGIKQWDMMGKT